MVHDGRVPGFFVALLRVAGALAALLAALLVGFLAFYAVAYAGSTGCEDYDVACRTADPALAGFLAIAGGVAVISLLVMSGSLLIATERAGRRAWWSGATAFVALLAALVAIRLFG